MTRTGGRLLREHNRCPTTPQQRPAPALRYRSRPTHIQGCRPMRRGKLYEMWMMQKGGNMGKLMQEMSRLARQAGGSHKTVHDRIALAQRFCHRLVKEQNVQIRQVAQLQSRHIESYIRERLTQGITPRSLQNEMAAIRCVLVQAGRNKLADSERISNRSLGLSGASRAGTHRAIPDDRYQQVLELARTKDPGLAAALELSRLMGLRSQEAVQNAQSLNTWQRVMEHGGSRLTVVFGTKGGRPRETVILNTDAVRTALANATAVAEDRNGRLIDKPDLKTAMKYWHSRPIYTVSYFISMDASIITV